MAKILKILNHSPQAAVVKQQLRATLNPMSSSRLQPQLLSDVRHSLCSREWSFGEGLDGKYENHEDTENTANPNSSIPNNVGLMD